MPPLFIMIFVFLAIVITHAIEIENFTTIYPSAVSPNDTRIPLTLGLMVSFSGDYVTSSSVAGVQLALDLINENSSLLPGYRLQYKLTDSQVCLAGSCIDYASYNGQTCMAYLSTVYARIRTYAFSYLRNRVVLSLFIYMSPYRVMPGTGK